MAADKVSACPSSSTVSNTARKKSDHTIAQSSMKDVIAFLLLCFGIFLAMHSTTTITNRHGQMAYTHSIMNAPAMVLFRLLNLKNGLDKMKKLTKSLNALVLF